MYFLEQLKVQFVSCIYHYVAGPDGAVEQVREQEAAKEDDPIEVETLARDADQLVGRMDARAGDLGAEADRLRTEGSPEGGVQREVQAQEENPLLQEAGYTPQQSQEVDEKLTTVSEVYGIDQEAVLQSIESELGIDNPEDVMATLDSLNQIHESLPDGEEIPDINATIDLISSLELDISDPEKVARILQAIQEARNTQTEDGEIVPQTDRESFDRAIRETLQGEGISIPRGLANSGPQIGAYSGSMSRGPSTGGSYENLSGVETNEVTGVHLFQEDTREIEDPRVQLDLRKMHRAWEEKCEQAGIVEGQDYAITSVGRSLETHQDNLRRGTSQASISKHCFGAAFDAVPLHNGQVRWNHADRPLLDRMGQIWKEVAQDQGIGVKWGGDWGWDPYHFELAVSSSQLRSMHQQGR